MEDMLDHPDAWRSPGSRSEKLMDEAQPTTEYFAPILVFPVDSKWGPTVADCLGLVAIE